AGAWIRQLYTIVGCTRNGLERTRYAITARCWTGEPRAIAPPADVCDLCRNIRGMGTMLKRRSVLAAAGWTIIGASAVCAQRWPSGQVKIVVPYIPGGATDTAGRLVAEKMTALLGQQVIVENRGGGNTIIGMELVAKSKPDGHTLLLGTTTLATNAALGLKQPYDPLKDFQ